MYMSYCRYEGTYSELRACLNDAEEHVNQYAEYKVSDREIQHFRNMVELFHEFLCEQGLLDADGNLDRDEIDKVCAAMAKSYAEEEEEE